jgi:glycosyltransferase involved in cell wall biosynthesis
VVPHIALNAVFPCAGDRVAARFLLAIPPDAPVILFFGSIRAYKGLEILIDAYLKAREIRPDLWLIVAGQPQSSHVNSITSRLDKQSIVELRYVPSDQVWVYHRAADIAVFPYHQASQSGALITAMGFGLPVIVTEVGGLPETVDGNGWIVAPDDPGSLAGVLIDAVSDMERLDQVARRSQQLIKERHSAGRVSRLMNHIYEEVLRCSVSSTAPIA